MLKRHKNKKRRAQRHLEKNGIGHLCYSLHLFDDSVKVKKSAIRLAGPTGCRPHSLPQDIAFVGNKGQEENGTEATHKPMKSYYYTMVL